MTLLALLAAIVGALGFVAGLKASRERDARVRAEIARDQARGEADVARATAAPAAVIAAADEARRKRAATVKRKIAAGKGGRK